MTKLKISVLSLVALFIGATVFVSCTKSEDEETTKLSSKLSVLKKAKTNNSEFSRDGKYTLEEVRSANNPYDYYGESLLPAFERIGEFEIKTRINPNATFNDVKPFIKNEIARHGTSNITFNIREQLLYTSFISNLRFENAIERVKLYEKFVAENVNNPADVKYFLIVISDIKYTAYEKYAGHRNFTQWENCMVSCMGETFGHYNAVNWIEFGTSPGGTVLWTAASCGWDCAN